MRIERYTARIGHGVSIAEDVTYDELVDRVLEFVVRAAISRANDDCCWEEDELRRQGLRAVEFLRDGRALWWDCNAFEAESRAAKRARSEKQFAVQNELGESFYRMLAEDLRERFRRVGYSASELFTDMKDIFREIAADASDRTIQAKESLVAEICNHNFS